MTRRFSVKISPSRKIVEAPRLVAKRLFSIASHQLCNTFSSADLHVMEKTQQSSPHLQGKLLIVEGNIAAGKSVFSKRLGKHFGFVVSK